MTQKKAKALHARGGNSSSPEQVRVVILNTLSDGRYVARTIKGLSSDAHLDISIIKDAIRRDEVLRQHLKIYPRRASDGSVLVTTPEVFRAKAGLVDMFIDLFASKRPGVEDVA